MSEAMIQNSLLAVVVAGGIQGDPVHRRSCQKACPATHTYRTSGFFYYIDLGAVDCHAQVCTVLSWGCLVLRQTTASPSTAARVPLSGATLSALRRLLYSTTAYRLAKHDKEHEVYQSKKNWSLNHQETCFSIYNEEKSSPVEAHQLLKITSFTLP